jgi:methyl-accepting chemotaxis protein
MDGVTQQNAAMVEEATAAARSLAEEADQLAREVARFTLGGAPRSVAAPSSVPVVHTLQARAAQAGREIARSTVRRRSAGGGNAAVATESDWSEF